MSTDKESPGGQEDFSQGNLPEYGFQDEEVEMAVRGFMEENDVYEGSELEIEVVTELEEDGVSADIFLYASSWKDDEVYRAWEKKSYKFNDLAEVEAVVRVLDTDYSDAEIGML